MMYRIVCSVLLVVILCGVYYVTDVLPGQQASQPNFDPSLSNLNADDMALKNLKLR